MKRFVGGEVMIDGRLERADLVVDGGRIAQILRNPGDTGDQRADPETMDCHGWIVSPGFIDLQVNGVNGMDLTTDPSAIAPIARALPRFGVTAFLPTIVTSPAERRRMAIDTMEGARHDAAAPREGTPGQVGATPIGLHFEGPMISNSHLGAHTSAHVGAPDDDEIARWIESGEVALVTLAPETPGALELTERLVAGGITVSAGHTGMSPEQFALCRDAGLSYVTHLFNAMAPFHHRSPGPIGAVLADDAVVAGLICDFVHVDPIAIRMAWRSLGPARTSLVSDSSAALGAPYGTLRLGESTVVHDGSGVRTCSGALAGSALPLDQAVRNLVAATSCTLVEALATVTTTPADLLGLRERGRIEAGSHADLTIVDHGGKLVATVIGGTVAWRS
jgi:N-acetylglucosamine-6-phosphate deacetylase